MTKIAIIGAGLSGLILAKRLTSKYDITVFEKSRGVSGRMSTRYATPYEFDHGAQYFTARSEEFLLWLEDYVADGNVSLWETPVTLIGDQRPVSPIKFVASPKMNSLCKVLADGLNVQLSTRVASINRREEQWSLLSEADDELGSFDWIISAVPAPQAEVLLPPDFADRGALESVQMHGCFAVMLGYQTLPTLPWQSARVVDEPVGWITVNSTKPERNTAGSIVIQSNNSWAEAHLEDDRTEVEQELITCAERLAGTELAHAAHKTTHRWRYASTPQPAGKPFLIDRAQHIAAIGDWCLGGKVEAAFESASKFADHLLS